MAKSLEAAEGVIFRTRLSERYETAVVFPHKKNDPTTLEVRYGRRGEGG